MERRDSKGKERGAKDLDERNSLTEAAHKQNWELETGLRRMGLRNKPGKKPVWKYNKTIGAQTRSKGRGGIDWYRYQQVILKGKLLPFTQDHKKRYPHTIVQEDGAAPYSSGFNKSVYSLYKIKKLLWPGNSPDLNAIEATWQWMKNQTTKRGYTKSKAQLTKDWLACQESLDQGLIQRWVDRIKWDIDAIIDCQGGNKYIEGSLGLQQRKKFRHGLDGGVAFEQHQKQ